MYKIPLFIKRFKFESLNEVHFLKLKRIYKRAPFIETKSKYYP